MEPESIESAVDSVVSLNDSASEKMTVREATNALLQNRWKRDAAEQREAAPEAAASEPSPAQAEDAAPPQEATGEEVTATADQPETAPLDLPRSWAKDRAEVWAKLDRATQEYLLEHDSKASTEVRRTQNEAAEQRKAIEAERNQLEQARKQYEEALPMLLQTLQEQQQGQFSDIKTMADVERMAREDWPRYALWDAHQKKVAALNAEMQASQQRQQQEFQSAWSKFAKDEDARFAERAPEMADAAKAKKLSESGFSLLKDLGFSESDIAETWNGQKSLSLRDHRVQLLVRDAVLYRQAKAAVPKAAVKPVPNVQRPGSPAQHAPDADIRITNLEKQLERKGGWKDAAELLIARRAARQ